MRCRFRYLPLEAAISGAMAILLSSSVAAAQTPPPNPPARATTPPGPLSTPALAHRVEGKTVVVTTSDGQEHQGVFIVSETGLIASGQKSRLVVPFDRIVKVERVQYRLRNATFIGAAAGAGVWWTLVFSSCSGFSGCVHTRDETDIFIIGTLIAGGMGAGIGAGIGAIRNYLARNDDVIYDRSRATTMALVPIVSPTRKGLFFSVTWR